MACLRFQSDKKPFLSVPQSSAWMLRSVLVFVGQGLDLGRVPNSTAAIAVPQVPRSFCPYLGGCAGFWESLGGLQPHLWVFLMFTIAIFEFQSPLLVFTLVTGLTRFPFEHLFGL